MNKKIKKLCVTAVLIALGTVLSTVKIIQMPLGGTVTLVSMLPVILISVFYGTSYAILPCLLFGGIQAAIGGVFGWGLTPKILVGCIIFDYLTAFGLLSLGGMFRKKGGKGIVAGSIMAIFLRFISHVISGVVFFTELEQFELFGNTFANRPLLYSIAYNGLYMLPELVITAVVIIALVKTKALASLEKAVGL